jgi:hypothetical protein
MKKTKFEKIQLKCKDLNPCDCGLTELCDNEDNLDGICEEENCPKLKRR